jgi:SSS family solute:Na+ symporter
LGLNTLDIAVIVAYLAGVTLFGLRFLARHDCKVLEMGLSIASVAYGSLLGVFLLGLLTKYASERGAMVGMLCGFLLNLYLWHFTYVAFTWYVVLGSICTFILGYAASWLMSAGSISASAVQGVK